jgi:hypothetical protein
MPEMSCQEYFEQVRNIVDVIKSLGGLLCDDMHLKMTCPRDSQGTDTVVIKREKLNSESTTKQWLMLF